MSSLKRLLLPAVASLSLLAGCDKDPPAGTAPSAHTSEAPAASTPAAAAVSAPAPTASAPAEPHHDCPKNSSGEGSLAKPCEAKGTERMMEAAWTGKTDDKGPYFKVTNKGSTTILYGKIAVYFYDKAGKQLDVQEGGKPSPFKTCTGNLFGGVMKAAEKATMTFSCIKKETVPDGTTAIEAEVVTVGFSDASEKKVDFYWTNKELGPDARKKLGTK